MITTYSLFEYLLELNQEAAKELTKTYFNLGKKKTLLIFPEKRDKTLRISEHELRFVFTNLHGQFYHPHLNYAIEAPTSGIYSFSGKSKRSGSTDLSFYEGNSKVLNVELKANNPTQAVIEKDIEKLVKEDIYGAWCHIFENEDRGTLKSIFKKQEKAFVKYGNPKKPLYFSFLIIKTKTLITRKGIDGDEKNFHPNTIFSLKYDDYIKAYWQTFHRRLAN